MNSLILCEGKTDCVLLQYYLEKVHSWIRIGGSSFHAVNKSWSNLFAKNGNNLIISETKGCNRLSDGLITAVNRNENAAPGSNDEFFDKIVIFTDNDETDTTANMIRDIHNKLHTTSALFASPIQKNAWNKISIQSIEGVKEFELYVMFIPFDENGALETYLLNCIGSNDAYDKGIIDKGNSFVETVDPNDKYLGQRRLKTKAKFDVYFSVRTAADQYAERQNILKSVAWENYDMIRTDFKMFADLG